VATTLRERRNEPHSPYRTIVREPVGAAETDALSRRLRRATTPALVCVSTRMGLLPACLLRASAINWVLPHPAGRRDRSAPDGQYVEVSPGIFRTR